MVELHDSRDFKDAESVRSGQSHVTCQPAFFTPFQNPGGNAKPFCGNAEPQRWAAKYLGHGMVYRETFFAYPTASSSAPYPQGINSWNTYMSERTSPHVMSESQTPVQDQRCQSGPSARNSFVPSEGRCSKNYGADQQRLQISDPHFDKFPHQQHLLVGRKDSRLRYVLVHNFLRKLCCGSKKWRWLNQCMISNLRVPLEEFEHQILKYSMRRLLQH